MIAIKNSSEEIVAVIINSLFRKIDIETATMVITFVNSKREHINNILLSDKSEKEKIELLNIVAGTTLSNTAMKTMLKYNYYDIQDLSVVEPDIAIDKSSNFKQGTIKTIYEHLLKTDMF